MKGVLNPNTGNPGVGGTLGNAAGNVGGTVGNTASNVGQTLGNTASNIGQTAKDLGHTGSLSGFASDTASTLGQTARDTANTGANLVGDTGKTLGDLGSDTAATIGGGGLRQQQYYQQPLQSGYQQQPLQSGYQQQPLQSGYQQQPLQSGYQQQPLQSGYQQQPLQSGYQQQPLQSSYQQQPLQSGYQQPGLQQSTSNLQPGTYAQEVRMPSSIVHEKVEKPMIVREKILPQEKIEVQPVIHREREQLEVHEVVQPLHERDIAATNVRYETLPAQVRAEVRESDASFQTKYRDAANRYVGSYETQPVQREFLSKAPILEEHISKKILEEVQPVLYKETIAPTLIEETQPIYERVVEAPTIFEEVRDTVDLGVKYFQTPLTTQMSNLSVQEPATIHKETYIKKEIFSEPAQRQPTTESKKII
jgi:hypothetical protein